MTKVVAAFPGTGKSYFASAIAHTATVVDLDSGNYTLGYDSNGKARNSDFPNNYLTAIKEHLGATDLLLVGCQPEVIAALCQDRIPFTLVYPERKLKSQYIERLQNRHSPQSFINILSDKWDIFLDFLENQNDCEHLVLGNNQYISDVVTMH